MSLKIAGPLSFPARSGLVLERLVKREEHRVYNCLKMMRAERERERERALKCCEGTPDETERDVRPGRADHVQLPTARNIP